VKRFSILIFSAMLTLFLSLFVSFALPQATHHYPTPPQTMDPESKDRPEPSPTLRANLSQMQRDADDLARTAQTIPSDVANIRKGMLPKDVIEKLKQIEKLSKRLRTQLNQ
jgi:hypothetical protein